MVRTISADDNVNVVLVFLAVDVVEVSELTVGIADGVEAIDVTVSDDEVVIVAVRVEERGREVIFVKACPSGVGLLDASVGLDVGACDGGRGSGEGRESAAVAARLKRFEGVDKCNEVVATLVVVFGVPKIRDSVEGDDENEASDSEDEDDFDNGETFVVMHNFIVS